MLNPTGNWSYSREYGRYHIEDADGKTTCIFTIDDLEDFVEETSYVWCNWCCYEKESDGCLNDERSRNVCDNIKLKHIVDETLDYPFIQTSYLAVIRAIYKRLTDDDTNGGEEVEDRDVWSWVDNYTNGIEILINGETTYINLPTIKSISDLENVVKTVSNNTCLNCKIFDTEYDCVECCDNTLQDIIESDHSDYLLPSYVRTIREVYNTLEHRDEVNIECKWSSATWENKTHVYVDNEEFIVVSNTEEIEILEKDVYDVMKTSSYDLVLMDLKRKYGEVTTITTEDIDLCSPTMMPDYKPVEDDEIDAKEVAFKLPMSNIRPIAYHAISACILYGAVKYDNNCTYENGVPETYHSAMLRHQAKHDDGEYIDKESGLPHLYSVLFNAYAQLLTYEKTEQKFDIDKYVEDLKNGVYPK